jgi:hypothetical protein
MHCPAYYIFYLHSHWHESYFSLKSKTIAEISWLALFMGLNTAVLIQMHKTFKILFAIRDT